MKIGLSDEINVITIRIHKTQKNVKRENRKDKFGDYNKKNKVKTGINEKIEKIVLTIIRSL